MDWSIQEVARLAGTTSRTLRHYDDIGLLAPSRIGGNGYRYYDATALAALQRILLLRELGLGLPAIAEVLEGERDDAAALRLHLTWLGREKDRLDRQIASVRRTLEALEGGEEPMAEEMFDGFDHRRHKDEVVERWGQDAWTASDRWYSSLSEDEKRGFMASQQAIQRDFAAAHAAGERPDGDVAQAIAARHHEWVGIGWGGKPVDADAFIGLGDMYVADPRFGRNYGEPGDGGVEFVRDAMRTYAERNLR
ncbi:MerR family transcriptional regulator [Herbiconiux sp. SYSU D00978]|uniref:MerR family transcriptional regulator n=1 Tax=Herbiconiux sp. SYSU D00978 TaxID=2812562 RepID=UPI001A972F36|nr:MerR family transcriptional regulator [Herbiconiux sp. SYSU D00978]